MIHILITLQQTIKRYPAYLVAIGAIIIFIAYHSFSTTNKEKHAQLIEQSLMQQTPTYNIVNNFYYRASKIKDKDEIATIALIIPVITTLKVDNLQQGITLDTTVQKGDVVTDYHSDQIDQSLLNLIQNFAKNFNEIIVTQNPIYLENALQDYAKDETSLEIEKKALLQKLYSTTLEDFAVPNLRLMPYQLKYSSQNSNNFSYFTKNDGIWAPNLFEYTFNEKDQIYFQYLQQANNINIFEDILNYISSGTVVRLYKYNSSKTDQFLLIYESIDNGDSENKATILFSDDNGYLYNLTYRPASTLAYKKGFEDFLNIAYGIIFKNMQEFSNDYANNYQHIESKEKSLKQFLATLDPQFCRAITNNSNYLNIPIDILQKYNIKPTAPLDNLLCNNRTFSNQYIALRQFTDYFYAWKDGHDYIEWLDSLPQEQAIILKQGIWKDQSDIEQFDMAFKEYKILHKQYQLLKEAMDYEVVAPINKEDQTFIQKYISTPKVSVIEFCDNISCIEEIKKNDWKRKE